MSDTIKEHKIVSLLVAAFTGITTGAGYYRTITTVINTGSYNTSYEWVNIVFQTPYKTVNGTVYHIAYTTWDPLSTACISWGRDTSSSTDPGNPAYTGNATQAWSEGTSDQCYKIYTRPSP